MRPIAVQCYSELQYSHVGCCCNTCSHWRFPPPAARTLFTTALWVGGGDDVISGSTAATSSHVSRDRWRESAVLPRMSDTENDVIVWCCLDFDSINSADATSRTVILLFCVNYCKTVLFLVRPRPSIASDTVGLSFDDAVRPWSERWTGLEVSSPVGKLFPDDWQVDDTLDTASHLPLWQTSNAPA